MYSFYAFIKLIIIVTLGVVVYILYKRNQERNENEKQHDQ